VEILLEVSSQGGPPERTLQPRLCKRMTYSKNKRGMRRFHISGESSMAIPWQRRDVDPSQYSHKQGGIYAKKAITAAIDRFLSGTPPFLATGTGWHSDLSRSDSWSRDCPGAAPSRNRRSGREGELHFTRAPQSALGTGVSNTLSTPAPMPRGRPGNSDFFTGGSSRYRHRGHLGVQPLSD
jgi:hypothetical protein